MRKKKRAMSKRTAGKAKARKTPRGRKVEAAMATRNRRQGLGLDCCRPWRSFVRMDI